MRHRLVLLASVGAIAWSGCSHDWGPFEPTGGSGGAANGGGGAAAGGGGSANGGAANGGAGGGGGAGSSSACGNGKLDPGEECDDGNDAPNDGCTSCKVDCDPAMHEFKDPTTHHCYWVVADQLQWFDAQGSCSGPGRVDAAALSTIEELTFVKTHLSGDSWLGGHWVDNMWAWTNGEEKWNYGDDQMGAQPPWAMPHGDNHMLLQCVVEEANGDIDARNCLTENHPVVCERSPTVAKP